MYCASPGNTHCKVKVGLILERMGPAQSVYAIFKSKTGILIDLLDQSTFGPDYEEVVRQARNRGRVIDGAHC